MDADGSERSSWPGWRGRAREWRAVTDLLCQAEHGRGGVLLVEGALGMGKTRLLGEAADAAARRGFAVMRGATDEVRRLAPLAPLLSALEESAHSLLASGGIGGSDAADVRFWLMEQLRGRLEERAARGPVLLPLDDLHWADPTTLLALRLLPPDLASYPLVWMLARSRGSGDPALDRLYEVHEGEGATRIVLGPLDEVAVAEVADDVFDASPDVGLLALAKEAGGNPFFLVELFQGLRDENAVEVDSGHARLVSARPPGRLPTITRVRLETLSARTRQLLQVAAVLGHSFSVDDLAAMLGEPTGQLVPSLEEALAAEIVVPRADVLEFRHHLLWRAVSETLALPVRQALHREAGEMLLRRGGSAVPAAAHLMTYARPGDTRALVALDRAAREVLPSSPQTAADLAMRALDLTGPSEADRFDRTVTAISALTAAGRPSEAAELARTALDRVCEPGQTARLRFELAYVLMQAGRPDEATTEAEKVLTQPDLSEDLRGRAEHVAFRAMWTSHDFWRGRERAEHIVAAPERHDPAALVGALLLLAQIVWTEGCVNDGLQYAREATRLADQGPILVQHAHPRRFLVLYLTSMRRLEEAESVLQAMAEKIEALAHTTHAASPAIHRAVLRLAAGRLDDAAAEAQAGLAMAEEVGMHGFDLIPLAVLAIVAVRRGDVDAAAGYVERYQARQAQGVRFAVEWGKWAVALAAEARDGPQRAIEVLDTAFTDPRERVWMLMSEPCAAAWMTRTALAAGDRPCAEAIVATADSLAQRNPDFHTLMASAAHARGILHQDTTALAEAAATHLDPWGRASAAEDLGALLARTADHGADRSSAVGKLEQALDGYQRIGAHKDTARVRSRLRELGVRRRHWTHAERPTSGWASLTDTERQVAAHVAQGLTNRQVATQMYLSPHTVSSHLRQVFRKLTIASRVELARLTAERHTEAPPKAATRGQNHRGG